MEKEEALEVEEAGERLMVSLDADSFLTQSAKNLPATLLAWPALPEAGRNR